MQNRRQRFFQCPSDSRSGRMGQLTRTYEERSFSLDIRTTLATSSLVTGSINPRSVIMARIWLAGVTSNAGL